jgi:hypothetical protein
MCLFCKQLSHTSPHDTAAISQTAAPATPTSSTPRNPLKFAGNAIGMEKRWVVLIELYVLLQMFCLTHHTHHCCWAAAPSPRHDNDRLLIAGDRNKGGQSYICNEKQNSILYYTIMLLPPKIQQQTTLQSCGKRWGRFAICLIIKKAPAVCMACCFVLTLTWAQGVVLLFALFLHWSWRWAQGVVQLIARLQTPAEFRSV